MTESVFVIVACIAAWYWTRRTDIQGDFKEDEEQ
jgi:hypothetical protein